MKKKDKGGDKAKAKPKKAAKKADPSEAPDERQAQKRVAAMRDKLTGAMQDPLMRDQIVKAIREMLREKQ
jgi:hypothetical protein